MKDHVEKMQKKADRCFKLERQLHEQYAINNNAHTASFISFVVALFVLFGAFGYVYAHSSIDFPTGGLLTLDETYTLDVFFLLSVVVSGILYFLACLSLQIGYAQRRDHCVIYEIRKKYYCKIEFNNPKERTRRDFIPDYYNLFFWLFVVAQIFVAVACAVKIGMNACSHKDEGWSWWGVLVIICFLVQIADIILSFLRRKKLYKKYCDFVKKQFMKGKEFKPLLALYKEDATKTNCVVCLDQELDSEAKAVFYSKAFFDIFDCKKKDMKQSQQRLCVVRIANGSRTIYRKFQGRSIDGLDKDCVALSPNAWYELGIDAKEPQNVSVQKSSWFPYFWKHPNSATRVSFRIGLIGLGFTIAGCILAIVM